MITIDTNEATKDIQRIIGKFGKLGALINRRVPEFVAPAVLELMKIYDPPRRVTRKAAYGRSFQSDRQRRWFFWALDAGVIRVPYQRTFAMRRGWRIEGSGNGTRVVNDTEAAKFSMGDETQARLNKLVGWTTAGWRTKNPGLTVIRAAKNAVNQAIREAGL